MSRHCKRHRRSEAGIALLIAIFVLLLISVVAIALLVSSGTETALGANYRSSSTVYYAALAGLEEARGRLRPPLSRNPNYFGTAIIPTPFPLGQTVYVINRLPSENIAPWDSSNLYYDNEYQSEFGVQPTAWQSVYSVWDNNIQGIPGPSFKWVRINAVTDASLFLNINYPQAYHPGTAVYYDTANLDYLGNPWPSLVVGPTSSAVQVLEITALAYLPNGSKKTLQYLVAPIGLNNLSFPAALTMDGPNIGNHLTDSNPTYPLYMPYSAAFLIKGDDQEYYSSGASCAFGANPSPAPVRAIGYTVGGGDPSFTNITSPAVIGPANHGDYVGLGGASPNVYYVGNPAPPGPPTIASNLQSLSGLNSVVTTLSQVADLSLDGKVTPVLQNDSHNVMPAGMSATNPMTVVVNGDLDTTGWSGAGYGILLVTGTFTYDVNSSWNGIVLLIGKGVLFSPQSSGGNGQINGAMLLATTVDANYLPLSSLGSPSVDFDNGSSYGSLGIYYSSCWVQYVQSPAKYKILSFHEIPQS